MPAVDRSASTYIAGHRGMVGSAVWRYLESEGFSHLVGRTSDELDLRDRKATFAFFASERPRHVVVAAARVGGIMANATRPADFLSDNLRIQVNVLDAALACGVDRLIFLGSSCAYPRHARQPISEDALLTGALEPTNDAYAVAKIAGLMQVQAIRRQHGRRWISAMPSNLYGPGDDFDLATAHVLPALIRRFHDAVRSAEDEVTIWGTGRPRREFLHVDDLAEACLTLLRDYDDPTPINVGTGQDISIRDLALLVAEVAGYTGRITWDTTKPDGTPRKLLDTSRIRSLGWAPRIALRRGIEGTYSWFLAASASARR